MRIIDNELLFFEYIIKNLKNMNFAESDSNSVGLLSNTTKQVVQKEFSLKKAFLMVGVLGLIGCLGLSALDSQPDPNMVSLWEKECYSCTHCEGDKFEIIAAFYGDRVITGDLVHMYNNGERTFPAGDSVWGETWTEATKTLVVVYWNCGSYYTKVIYEGQALVLP